MRARKVLRAPMRACSAMPGQAVRRRLWTALRSKTIDAVSVRRRAVPSPHCRDRVRIRGALRFSRGLERALLHGRGERRR